MQFKKTESKYLDLCSRAAVFLPPKTGNGATSPNSIFYGRLEEKIEWEEEEVSIGDDSIQLLAKDTGCPK